VSHLFAMVNIDMTGKSIGFLLIEIRQQTQKGRDLGYERK
jgi:hypothetical protein